MTRAEWRRDAFRVPPVLWLGVLVVPLARASAVAGRPSAAPFLVAAACILANCLSNLACDLWNLGRDTCPEDAP